MIMGSQSWCCVCLLVFFIALGSSMAGRPEKENPLLELSREEFVEMAGYGEHKLSSVLVTGAVLCEASVDGDSEPQATPVSGAKVAVACSSVKQPDSTALTDKYGDFIIDLPSHLHAIPNLEKTCTLRVLELPKTSPCNRVFVRKPKEIKLASIGNGIRTYNTETITLRQPQTSQPSENRFMKMIW